MKISRLLRKRPRPRAQGLDAAPGRASTLRENAPPKYPERDGEMRHRSSGFAQARWSGQREGRPCTISWHVHRVFSARRDPCMDQARPCLRPRLAVCHCARCETDLLIHARRRADATRPRRARPLTPRTVVTGSRGCSPGSIRQRPGQPAACRGRTHDTTPTDRPETAIYTV